MKLKILGFQCKKCDTIHYPSRTRCSKCGHVEFKSVPLPDTGTLLTFTHLHTLPADFEVTRLSLGIVELDNGVRVTGQLEIAEPVIGMKVRGTVGVVRRDDYNKFYGMIFSAL